MKEVKVLASSLSMPNGGIVSASLYDVSPAKNDSASSVPRPYWESSKPNFDYSVIAERLIFLMPKEKLNVRVTLDKASYKPGDEVKYTVDVTEARTGKAPKGSVLISLAATDESAFLESDLKKLPASVPF